MNDKKIVFVVGHENWGKSKTLKALTNNNRYIKKHKIGIHTWFIRRMSNDDYAKSYYSFMEEWNESYLIAAFCPNFDKARCQRTKELLNDLKNRGYKLHFWVLQKKFSSGEQIDSAYIQKLYTYGNVEVYSGDSEAKIRASVLKEYIENSV